MFVECQQFLKEALKEAGIRTPPITTMKQLKLCADSHIGAILFEEDTLTRSGSKRITGMRGAISKRGERSLTGA